MEITIDNITYLFDEKNFLKNWEIVKHKPMNSYEYRKLIHLIDYYINKYIKNNDYLPLINKIIKS